jgi:predicted RNase H-like HicB family nuclease
MTNYPEHYSTMIAWSDEDQAYIVRVPELPGCRTHGRTYEEGVRQGKDAIARWLDAQHASGRPLPAPCVFASTRQFSSSDGLRRGCARGTRFPSPR